MYTTIIEPRISETDAVGHINNTVAPVWFEAGRAGLFAEFRPDHSLENWPLVIKTYTITFDHELVYGQDVTVECRIARIGRTSLALHESIMQGERVCVIGEVLYVHVGEDRRPSPLPAEIKERLGSRLEETHV